MASALSKPRVQIRYFTDRQFHSKLYIFGDRRAIVGSSNLTDGGLEANREVAVIIPSNHAEAFDRLVGIFECYWNQAEPFDHGKLQIFARIYQDKAKSPPTRHLDEEIKKHLGSIAPAGIRVGDAPRGKNEREWSDYKKTFQVFEGTFKEVSDIYVHKLSGARLMEDTSIPLHVEVQAFMSYLREKHLRGDDTAAAPVPDRA